MGAAPPPISLAAWRQGGASFQHQGQRIFYRATDDAQLPPLLLIHGFPTGSWDFAKLWGPLAQRFRLIAPDMIGFGFSAKPRRFPYSVFAQADLMQGLLGHLAAPRYHVLAHDYGDTIAQELLARHLEGSGPRLQSVCFLNGGLFPETHHALLIQKLMLTPLGPLLAQVAGRGRFDRTMTGLFAPERPPTTEELDGFWELVSRDGGRALLPRHLRYIIERRQHRERFVGALIKAAQAGLPLRLIDGARDPVSGAHMAARYRELVPSPDVVLLEHLSHYPHVEDPDAVLAPFLAFHRRIAAS